MSSSIAIPRRKQPVRSLLSTPPTEASSRSLTSHTANTVAASYASSSSPSSTASSPLEPSSKKLGKNRMVDQPIQHRELSGRRPSLLGSSLSKSEYTVINLNSDGPPRLITCVKSSQGFDWNQELFLPSYMDFDPSELELRQDPVHDIILTDEEAAAMLP